MANRRMFSSKIVESDAFKDLEPIQQALYFHMGMEADDDGFVNNPRSIARSIGASIDDINALIEARFIICFESGIVCIKHWKINNYIQKDRYQETSYSEEKAMLEVKENGAYTFVSKEDDSMYTQEEETLYTQEDDSLDTQYRLGKDSIGKYSIEREKEKERENLPLSDPLDTEEEIPFDAKKLSVDDIYDLIGHIDFKFPIEQVEPYFYHRKKGKWRGITDRDALLDDMRIWMLRDDDYKAKERYG